MKKIFTLLATFLCFVLFLDALYPLHSHPACADGTIVTSLEDPLPKKAAPKKKPHVKKEVKPTPPPIQEIPEEIVNPTPLEEALILMEQRFFARATTLLEKILAEEPRNAHAWYTLGRAYEARGFFPKAQRAFRRTLELDPTFHELSRFLQYPAEGDRQPLWDQKRPARIEEIPVAIDGFTIMPPSENVALPANPVPQQTLYIPPAPPVQSGPLQEAGTPSLPAQPSTSKQNAISPTSGVPVRVVQLDSPPYQQPASPLANASLSPLSEVSTSTSAPLLSEGDRPAYIPPTPTDPITATAPPLDIASEASTPVYTPPPPDPNAAIVSPDITSEASGPVYTPPPPDPNVVITSPDITSEASGPVYTPTSLREELPR